MFLRSFNTLIRRSSAPVPSIQSRSFRIIIGVDEEEEGARKYSQRRADEKQIVKDVWNELLEDADSDACDPYLGERMEALKRKDQRIIQANQREGKIAWDKATAALNYVKFRKAFGLRV